MVTWFKSCSARVFIAHAKGWRVRFGVFVLGFIAAMMTGVAAQADGPVTSKPADQGTAVLQFYGPVTMRSQKVAAPGQVLSFDCQTARLAEVLLSQLHADMTWDGVLGPKSVTLPGGVPALQQPGSLLVLVRRGTTVYAVSGPTPAAVEQALSQAGLTGKDASFRVDAKIPASLNFTDLRPMYMAVHQLYRYSADARGWARYSRQVLDVPYKFWRKRHLPFGFNYRTAFGFYDLADGPPLTFPNDYEIAQAKKFSVPFYAWFGPWLAPWWMRTAFPHEMIQLNHYGIPLWNPLMAESTTALNTGSASAKAMSYVTRNDLAMFQSLRKAGGRALAAIRISTGWPGDEMNLHMMSTELMGFSDASERGLRRWLRDKRQVTLPQLGERWYGDPHHFAHWRQVMLPSLYSFFGDFGEDTFNLLKGWRWRPNLPQAIHDGWWRSDYQPGKKWLKVDLAPSMEQLFLFGSRLDKAGWRKGRSTVAWFRKSFDPGKWLAQARRNGRQVYLVADTYSSQPVQVFFNGLDLGSIKAKGHWMGPIGMEVTGLVKPGRNVLVMEVPRGMIPGPVFLTTHQPGYYPYADWHKNARWVDMRDWLVDQTIRGYERTAAPVVRADPDMPIMLNIGSGMPVAGHLLELKRKFGMSVIYNTGAQASFRPHWPGLGYVLGAYGGSEESNTNWTPAGLTQEFGWLMFNGESMHTFVYTSEHYQKIEQQTHWFTNHRRQLDMFGKATWTRPQVALFLSAKESTYFPRSDTDNMWDLGRGRLQRTFFNNVYVTGEMIRAGLADAYPVVIDGNNQVLDKQTLAALKRYVRQGGTYVVLNLTGQDSPLHADSWPIEQLTGCRVLGRRQKMMVRVLKDNPLLKHLAGDVFQGSGLSVDWMGHTPGDSSFALAPQKGTEFKPLALWEDGTVAAGVRYLGKGRVVVLASTFWSKSSDRAGRGVVLQGSIETAFLRDLLHGLGLVPPVTTSDPDVWAVRFITKDGLQNWMMMRNSASYTKHDITLRFHWPRDPGVVYDAVSGKPVAYRWHDGRVTVSGLTVKPHDIRVFAVNRASFGKAVEHWFAIKAKYHTRLPAKVLDAMPSTPHLPPAGMLVIEHFQFRQAKKATPVSDTAWINENDRKAPWRKVGYGFWDDLGYKAHGVGYYRRSFNLPSAWQGHRVLLALASFNTPIFLQDADIYCNGHFVYHYQGRAWANFRSVDLTASLHPGRNEVEVRVQAKQARGGYLGQVFLFPLRTFKQKLNLNHWTLYQDPLTFSQAALPIKQTEVRDIRTRIKVPADWPADHIFIQMNTGAKRWVSCVVVNGRPIGFNQYLHPFGQIAQLNLYPWIRPGQVNTIELWPYDTLPNSRGSYRLSPLKRVSLSRVVLGVTGMKDIPR